MKSVGEIGQTAPGGRHAEKMQRRCTHLFNRKLLQLRQRAGEQPHQEGSGTANNIQHGAGQHGDEGVLPGEGVEQRHHCMYAAGQGTNDGRQKKKRKRDTHHQLPSHSNNNALQRPHQIKLSNKTGQMFLFPHWKGSGGLYRNNIFLQKTAHCCHELLQS